MGGTSPLAALAALVEVGWLVGGAVRDELLGRPSFDYDVVIEGNPREVARALGRSVGAHPFALSEAFGAWRVVARDHSWQVDLTSLAGSAIEQDLARRDLTINAIARPLHGGAPLDPCGGLADLAARRLRTTGPEAFASDPLRVLRLARIAAELDFEIEAATLSSARRSAAGLARVSAERVFAELRLLLCSERPVAGIRVMDELGASAVVLPELEALRGITQSDYHHLDVHDHTIAVLEQAVSLCRDPAAVLGEHGSELEALLAEPLANELTRGQALRFGALLHDIAKPQTRAVSAEGRVTFIGHDQRGAELVRHVLERLRASERLICHVQALTRNHLRLGFLVHSAPLSRREIYRYLAACEPVEVDVTLLSVADRLATRGRGSAEAIARHLELARSMLGPALAWRAQRPRPPIRGDQLARALSIRPGPRLGSILAELEQAAYAGEISDEEGAVALARELLEGEPAAER